MAESFTRIHLLENQDIKNIGRSFDVDKVKRHANDQDSVLSWIKDWENSEEIPVLFYKMQGN